MTENTQSRRPTRTWGRTAQSSAATATVAALIVATAGVIVQILAGVDFPTVPPVLFILLIPAVLVYVGHRWWWSAIPAVLAGLFLTVGLFLSGESVRLFDTNLPGGAGGSAGLWVQTLAVAVAAVTGAITTAQRYRGG
jgi:hypothetical protein